MFLMRLVLCIEYYCKMELDIYKIISKYHVGGYQMHRDFWIEEL